jgi:hypothetical protein
MPFKHMNGASEKANLVCNSIATCVDNTRAKSNIKDPDVWASYKKALMHEHDLSVIADNKNISLAIFISVVYVVRYWIMHKFKQINIKHHCYNHARNYILKVPK